METSALNSPRNSSTRFKAVFQIQQPWFLVYEVISRSACRQIRNLFPGYNPYQQSLNHHSYFQSHPQTDHCPKSFYRARQQSQEYLSQHHPPQHYPV